MRVMVRNETKIAVLRKVRATERVRLPRCIEKGLHKPVDRLEGVLIPKLTRSLKVPIGAKLRSNAEGESAIGV